MAGPGRVTYRAVYLAVMPTQCGCIVSTDSQAIWFARVYSESSSRIDVLSRRVQEGRDVLAASEFCRWLLFSGIIKLLEENPNPAPLKVDGAHLQWKCEELLQLCNSRLRSPVAEPCLTAGYLQSLHDKVDLVAGYLSRITAGSAVGVNPVSAAPVDPEDVELDSRQRSERAQRAGPLA